MSTSGTYTSSRNRDQIIKRAARIIGAIEAGETMSSEEVTDFSEALNAMVKHWQTLGQYIWTTREAALFLQTDQVRYELGTTGADHATESFTRTTLSADAASGDTSFSITSATGFATTQYLGIELDDGLMQWTTVSGLASTVVTPTAALTGAASTGNSVITYATKLVRPLKVLSARRYNFSSALDTPLSVYDKIEYHELPNKTSEGVVNGIMYDRRGGANATGHFYTWQEPANVDDCIKFTFARPIQDFTTAADDPDLPQEWMQALVWNLADQMSLEYDVPGAKASEISRRAGQYLAEAGWGERELTAIQFVPGFNETTPGAT